MSFGSGPKEKKSEFHNREQMAEFKAGWEWVRETLKLHLSIMLPFGIHPADTGISQVLVREMMPRQH